MPREVTTMCPAPGNDVGPAVGVGLGAGLGGGVAVTVGVAVAVSAAGDPWADDPQATSISGATTASPARLGLFTDTKTSCRALRLRVTAPTMVTCFRADPRSSAWRASARCCWAPAPGRALRARVPARPPPLRRLRRPRRYRRTG